MILTIILIILIVIFIVVFALTPYELAGLLSFVVVFVSAVVLIVHIVAMIKAPLNYKETLVQRESIQRTIDNFRENGNELETAAMVMEVAEWNASLASAKFWNTTVFGDPYYDDRIDSLKEIH